VIAERREGSFVEQAGIVQVMETLAGLYQHSSHHQNRAEVNAVIPITRNVVDLAVLVCAPSLISCLTASSHVASATPARVTYSWIRG
jgi:hypothetical protein